jgi:hypothetical protein
VLAVQQIGSRQLLVNVSAALPVSTDQAALAAQDLSAGAHHRQAFVCALLKPAHVHADVNTYWIACMRMLEYGDQPQAR